MKRLVTLLTLVVVVLAGCSPAPAPSTPATTGAAITERRSANQEFRYAVASLPVSMSIESTETAREQFALMYDTLVWMNREHEVQPWAAEKWELVNPTTWRLFLRKDLTFSNGDKLTAADAEFTAKWVLENKTSPIAQISQLADVKAIDDYTIDFVSKTNDVSTLIGLSFMVIMPKKYFESVGRQGFALKPIGSGPYELAEFRSGDMARYKLRSTAHPFRKPILTDVTVQVVPEASAVVAGLKLGTIDFATVGINDIPGLEREGLVIQTPAEPGQGLFVLYPATETEARNLPTKDKKVRQALNYAIDREALAKTVYGGRAKPAGQLVPPGSPFYDPAIAAYPYDPAKAKQLLAEAGYPNGFTLQNPMDLQRAWTDATTAIQGYLRAVGVNVEYVVHEQGIYVDKFRGTRPKGDLFVSSLYDPNGFNTTIRGYFGCDALYNSVGNVYYCNKEFDRLHAQAASEPDMAKRTNLLRQASRIIAVDDVCCIFVLFTTSYRAHSPKLKGFVWGEDRIWNMDAFYKVD